MRSKYLAFSLWVGVGYLEKYTNATWTGHNITVSGFVLFSD